MFDFTKRDGFLVAATLAGALVVKKMVMEITDDDDGEDDERFIKPTRRTDDDDDEEGDEDCRILYSKELTAQDGEILNERFSPITSNLTAKDREDFYTSYVIVKRELEINMSEKDADKSKTEFLQALAYISDVKKDSQHPDRGLLGETVRIVKEDLLDWNENPTTDYLKAVNDISMFLIKNEGSEIYSVRYKVN